MKLWKKIKEKLQNNLNVYLLTVVENSGSSPGRQGFKMMIAEDGFIYGTIGGGVMEHQFVEQTKELFKNDTQEIFLKKQIHQKNCLDSSGMICSGEQTVVFHPLYKKDISTIDKIISSIEKKDKGEIILSNSKFSFSNKFKDKQFEFIKKTELVWNYKEQTFHQNIIYIIGGGHVSLATSEIMKILGFYVVVFDNRKNINTFEENNFADEKHTINYNDIANYIKDNNFIAIMTNKYTEDKLVLSKIIISSQQYIGVLGSKSKMNNMFNILLEEGYTKVQLNKLFTPIGLSIKSQTPSEIAISIAAQIIAIKNKNL